MLREVARLRRTLVQAIFDERVGLTSACGMLQTSHSYGFSPVCFLLCVSTVASVFGRNDRHKSLTISHLTGEPIAAELTPKRLLLLVLVGSGVIVQLRCRDEGCVTLRAGKLFVFEQISAKSQQCTCTFGTYHQCGFGNGE